MAKRESKFYGYVSLTDYKVLLSVVEIHEICRRYYECGFKAANPKLFSQIMNGSTELGRPKEVKKIEETNQEWGYDRRYGLVKKGSKILK
jgi:hypothetical protein